MWSELISQEMDRAYKITANLMDLVDEQELNWKPTAGANWMTTGQLMQHLATCCAPTFRGFATGDWGMPAGEDMLPPAEKMATATSKAEAKRALAEDQRAATAVLASLRESDLENKTAAAPWDPRPMKLGYRLLEMVAHQNQHKGQLFYYLKMQGKPVNTAHLWGM
jgi:uncharacterized damage-inducible protein DinB